MKNILLFIGGGVLFLGLFLLGSLWKGNNPSKVESIVKQKIQQTLSVVDSVKSEKVDTSLLIHQTRLRERTVKTKEKLPIKTKKVKKIPLRAELYLGEYDILTKTWPIVYANPIIDNPNNFIASNDIYMNQFSVNIHLKDNKVDCLNSGTRFTIEKIYENKKINSVDPGKGEDSRFCIYFATILVVDYEEYHTR